MLFGIYRLITNLFYPFSSLYLKYRILKKKESIHRYQEKISKIKIKREAGK